MTIFSTKPIKFIINFCVNFGRNLYLSCSSSDFYRDVLRIKKGYGLRFLLAASFISTLIYSIVTLSYIKQVDNFFNNGEVSAYTRNLALVIEQWPELKYQNGEIDLEEGESYIIYDSSKQALIAIGSAQADSSLVKMSKKHFYMPLSGDDENFQFEYSKLLPSDVDIIDADFLMEYGRIISAQLPRTYIYIAMPILIIVNFISDIISAIPLILLTYVILQIRRKKVSLENSFRLISFASGLYLVLRAPVILLVGSSGSVILLAAKVWTLFLMFSGVARDNK